ncbi:acyltransferase family protein [Flavitalea sp.]|nr:acyltransferase [Flavitalea sp.]
MSKIIQLKIAGYTSIFLDAVRLLASLLVVAFHARDQWIPSQAITPTNNSIDWAHAGVIIFFVLSGYVISYTTGINSRGPLQYSKARLSRLTSMVLPALVITAIVEITISLVSPELKAEYTRGISWPRYLISSLFLNEAGFMSAAPPVNGPLWSLSYEFWYYVLFGLFIFGKSNLKSFAIIVVAALVAGPKILLMMPIWIAGCLAFKKHINFKNSKTGWLLSAALFGCTILAIAFVPRLPEALGGKPFYFSNQFLSDYIIGFFFASALIVMPFHVPGISVKEFSTKFRTIADLTFPIYVLHHPLLILWRAVVGYHPESKTEMVFAIVMSTVVAALIGIWLENLRGIWSKQIDKLFDAAKGFYTSIKSSYLRTRREKA